MMSGGDDYTDDIEMPEHIYYLEQPCEQCNRVRVELLTDGDHVCEKCYWSQLTREFKHDLREYWS